MRIQIPDLLRLKPGLLIKTGKYLQALKIQKVGLILGEGIEAQYGQTLTDSFETYRVQAVAQYKVTNGDTQALFNWSQQLPSDLDGFFALGGGMALDAAKYIAHLNQLPLLVCPGAISNDGFASPFSSLLVNGQKRSLKTSMPQGIMLDPELISKAPPLLFYAGVGDLISNLTAIADWKLAFHRRGVYVDDFAVSMAQMAVDNFIHLPDKSPAASLNTLAQSLMMSGIAMAIAGSSRPGSGSEHLISHALDRHAKRPLAHGLQVGLASYWVSLIKRQQHLTIKSTLESAGVLNQLRELQPLRQDWQQALLIAPSIKAHFYTLLDEPGVQEQLLAELKTDAVLSSILK